MKIGTGRYSELLGRLLGQSGVLEVAGELSPEISPVFVLESDRPEWLFLSNQRLMSAGGIVAAVALSPSFLRLRNPTGSNVIAVIERGTIASPTTIADAVITFGTAAADRANGQTVATRDSRWGTLSSGALKASSDNAASAGTQIDRLNLLALSPHRIQAFPIIMLPGSHLDVGTNDQNATVIVMVHYREREIGKFEIR